MRLRSEAEAPWRSLRLTLFGFSVASAGMGTLISLPQLIGALGGAPGALAVETVLQNLAINLGAVGIFSFLFSRDWKVGCVLTDRATAIEASDRTWGVCCIAAVAACCRLRQPSTPPA